SGPTWLFDIDSLTRTMSYQPVTIGNQTNPSAGFQETFDTDKAGEEANQQYMLFPVWSTGSSNPQNKEGDVAFDEKEHDAKKPDNDVSAAGPIVPTAGQNYSNSTNPISVACPLNSNTSPPHGKSLFRDAYQPSDMLEREDIAYSDHENVGAEADFNDLETSITMDVKSAFLYGTIEEEVLLELGQIDQTLFIKKQKGDILLVQIYVDDIIFGATNKDLCKSFEKLMKDKFQMSSMGELTFFLGKSASTPIDIEKPLLKDPDGKEVDVHIYRSMIEANSVATSSTVAEYVAGASCCAQVPWIQNQMLDYGKSDASEGFNQIIDFLNGSYIEYALTVNLTIYVSCIKQFWKTVAVKSSNDVTRLQALVDKKKVVVTKAAIRDALHLDDAEGSMSAKRTSWNEFSSAMASAVIYLSTGKGCLGVETPLFKRMLVAREPEEQGDAEEQGNADNATEEPITAASEDDVEPQSLTSAQLQGGSKSRDYKAKDKGEEAGEGQQGKTLKLKRLRKVGTSQRVDTSDDTIMEDVSNQGKIIEKLDKDEGAVLMNEKEETEKVRDNTGDAQVEGRQADIYQIDMDHAAKVLSMQEDESKVQEVVEVVTTAKLITEVVAAVSETVSAAAVSETVSAAATVPTDPEEESSAKTPTETKSKDKGKGIMVEEPKLIKKKQQVELDEAYARKLHEELNQDIDWETEAQARRNMMMYLKNTTGFRLDYFKGMSYDDLRPIFEAKFNANMEFLLKSKEQIEEETNRAIESINETPAQKAAKRRRLNEEAKDVEELKQHLEIVPDEDDDVYTKATPLARKVPVVDY
nr:hypothetical protein [Tanacetum cinerariifolium]